MASNKPAKQTPSKQVQVVDDAIRNLRLVWCLFLDPRVNPLVKLIPITGLAYVISPIDFMPASICGPAGWADDATVMIIAVALFLHLIPRPLVEEARRKIG